MTTFLKKLYDGINAEKAIILIPLVFLFGIWMLVSQLIPYMGDIMNSATPLAWVNAWMQICAFEMLLAFFLGFILDAWFYNTKRIQKPFVFAYFIAGGMMGASILSLIVLPICEASYPGAWHLGILGLITGAWLGLVIGFFMNLKK